MLKRLAKLLINFKLYLFIGIVCLFLAPILEYNYGVSKSLLFAKYAFYLLFIATLLLFGELFIGNHPAVVKPIQKIYKKIWKYLKKIGL